MKDKSVYIIVADEKDPEGKVYHGCFVGQNGTKAGMKSPEWSSTVSKLVGGKAGGKEPVAIGTGTEQSKIDEALKAATDYLE
ncbi:alanyl-tRNA synthetase, partial [Aspergillus sclerotialis]